MSTVTEEEKVEMTEERQKSYCQWCWVHDFGLCSVCALNTRSK